MKATELRELDVKELNDKLSDLKEELFNLRFQHAINQLENPNKLKDVKRDIARVKTVIRELKLVEEYGYTELDESKVEEETSKAKKSKTKKEKDKEAEKEVAEAEESEEETAEAEESEEETEENEESGEENAEDEE